MAYFTKTMLSVGTLNANGQKLVVTPTRIKNWVKQFKRFKANGQHVPSSWDHADDNDDLMPLSSEEFKEKKRSAKDTVGELVDVKALPGNKAIEFTVELFRPDAIEAAKSNKVFLSPVIANSWEDGGDNRYNDVITHLDVVNHPVDHTQGPFVSKDAGVLACGIRQSSTPKVIFMAMEDEDKKDEEEEVTKMSDEESSDDAKDGDGDGVVNEGESDEKAEEAPEEKTGRDAKIAKNVEALAAYGIVLEPDTDSSNFHERLDAALTALKGAEEGDDMTDSAPEEAPMVATMSLQSRNAFNWAQNKHREEVKGRLDRLFKSGRCTKAEYDQHKRNAGMIKLSLDKSGAPKTSKVEDFIVSREGLPVGCCWNAQERITKLSLKAVDPPEEAEVMTEERANKLVDEMYKRGKAVAS